MLRENEFAKWTECTLVVNPIIIRSRSQRDQFKKDKQNNDKIRIINADSVVQSNYQLRSVVHLANSKTKGQTTIYKHYT
jgi:hypothetical protein